MAAGYVITSYSIHYTKLYDVEAILPVARVAVLVSMNIRPYIEATQGITRVLKQAGTDFEVILLDEFTEKSRDILVNKLAQGNFTP